MYIVNTVADDGMVPQWAISSHCIDLIRPEHCDPGISRVNKYHITDKTHHMITPTNEETLEYMDEYITRSL